ncbi:hypothetical protein AB0P36_23645 [Streptomyces flavidovirens]|uniref:hypothetical protein n=1 Tax=Streptomyces flavidovirens TaxID=67298 RepID=UPI00342B516A
MKRLHCTDRHLAETCGEITGYTVHHWDRAARVTARYADGTQSAYRCSSRRL